MKLEKMALANAFALAAVVLWALCSLFVAVFPDFSLSITQWWMHGLDISAMGKWNLTFSNFIFGGIALGVSFWVIGYVFAWSWELTSKK